MDYVYYFVFLYFLLFLAHPRFYVHVYNYTFKQNICLLDFTAPPLPSPQVFPTEVARDSTTIHIRYRKNYFSDINGPVIKYTIIVAEDHSKLSKGLELPTWQDVQSYPVWPPYQVSFYYSCYFTWNIFVLDVMYPYVYFSFFLPILIVLIIETEQVTVLWQFESTWNC